MDVYVLLPKWRDVVFDLNTGSGATYIVESTQDWMYDIEAKKRVKKATFQDGERFHIWVGRFFKGDLLLKSKGKLIGKYTIGIMDPYLYSAVGDDKPAPIIIALGKGTELPKGAPTPVAAPSARLGNNGMAMAMSSTFDPLQDFNAAVHKRMAQAPENQVMHVVEVTNTSGPDVPREIADFFKKGGEETAIDSSSILTRNWLWSQITGAAAYLNDNRKWIQDVWKADFRLEKRIHKSGPKWYVIFQGIPKLGPEISAWKYGADHAKMLAITGGAASVKGMANAAWQGAVGSLTKAGLLTVFFTISLDVAEWMNDYEQRDPVTGKPKKDFFDLAFKIGIDLAKAGISGALGAVAMAGLITAAVSLLSIFGITLVVPVIGVVVGTIFISVGIGLGLDWLDKSTGFSDSLNKTLRSNAAYLESKGPSDYGGYGSALEQALAYGGMGA